MNYKILVMFAIAATLSLSLYSNAFATNGNLSNLNTQKNNNDILITKLLAKNLENHIQKVGSILNITSKLPQLRTLSVVHTLNQTLKTLHGIPQGADKEKRQVAKNTISNNSDLYEVAFFMPNGDIYLSELYAEQQSYNITNYAFREWFQGAIKTDDTFLGNVITTKAPSAVQEAVIAVPVYSLKDNSTIVGVWGGCIDFNALNKELQSLNLVSLGDGAHVVYVGHLGLKVADSDVHKSKTQESFANLQSFKNAINGQFGSVTDTIDDSKMMVTYQPVKIFHNTWAVLLMQPIQQQR